MDVTRETPPTGGDSYRIGSATLDLRSRQLCFDGDAADVQPKVFDLLVYLVEHRDRVVGKDELFDKVWPTVVVSDASLSQTIKRARDLFRSQGFERDIIRTIPRRGYQFDHPVEVAGTDATPALSPPPAVRRTNRLWLLLSGIGAILLLSGLLLLRYGGGEREAPPPESAAKAAAVSASALAVLPLENLTPDAEFAYFTDGLTETLINNLATVRGLKVIARSSAYSAARTETDPTVIAAQLRVANLLLGSVQRDGDTLRISVRLVAGEDGAPLWSHQYSRLMDDIFAVQDAIAASVVRELSGRLAVDLSAPRALGIAETAETAEAYRLVLRGIRERRRGSREAVRTAEQHFRDALAVAPDFAPALVQLSEAVRWRGVTGSLPRDEAFREALALVERAVRLSPEYGQAYLQLAELQHRHFWDFAGAGASYARALTLLPGSGELHSAHSRFLAKAGATDAALAAARESEIMNPRSFNVRTNLILRLLKAGRLAEARTSIETLRRLNPEHIDLPWLETNWHLRNGDNREALQWITLEELDYLRLSLSAIALQRLERTAQARSTLDELIETDAEGSAFQIGEVYAQWGDSDEAFAWLERALQNGDPGLIELYSSLNLEPLYDDPRFVTLAERIGLPPRPGAVDAP